MDTTTVQFIQAALAAALVGFSKTGVPGLGILIVPILAGVFGPRAANGILLPMLLFADFFAVGYYRQHANWPILIKLLPWVLGGLGLGYVALDRLSNESLSVFFGILILSLVGLQAARQGLGGWLEEHLPKKWWFSAVMGVLAGFTTMVGNLAGSITGIYLISMRVDKHSFMGTSAWFYLTVNALKVPLYCSLGLITGASLVFDVKMAVFILLGVATGVIAFKVIPQKWFDRVVLALASIAALRLLFM
jgi:hypothetical protein